MKPVANLIAEVYKSEISQICRLVKLHQNVQIIALPGTGLSTLIKYVLVDAFTPLSNLNIVALDATDSDFIEQISNLSSQISTSKQSIIIIDEFSKKIIQEPYLHLFSRLLDLRRDLDFSFSFVITSNQLVDVALLPKINRILIENVIYLPAINAKYIKEFLKINNFTLSISQKNEIVTNAYGNFRLAKIISQIILNNKLSSISQVQPQTELQLDYFIKELLGYVSSYPPKLLPSPSPLLNRYIPYFRSSSLDLVDHTTLPVLLTAREKKVFYILHRHLGHIVTRTSLLKFVWGSANYFEVYDHSLDQIIYRLKKKLRESRSNFSITTRKGRGFILTG